ncbi:MAG: hypothetical protein ACHQX1_01975 [Candidatus Micrarchaeales archaeon]
MQSDGIRTVNELASDHRPIGVEMLSRTERVPYISTIEGPPEVKTIATLVDDAFEEMQGIKQAPIQAPVQTGLNVYATRLRSDEHEVVFQVFDCRAV